MKTSLLDYLANMKNCLTYIPVLKKYNEGLKLITTKFKLIYQIEMYHKQLFTIPPKCIESGFIYSRKEKVNWVSRKCGYLNDGKRALKNCPAFEHPQANFEIMSENY